MKMNILGKETEAPFDIDPVTLYDKSHSIREYKLVMTEEIV